MSQSLSLPGCTPAPLGNYLKALGVFRLIAEQADPSARAWWKGGIFHLYSRFANSAELVQWLCEQYEPSPLIAPWSVNSGAWPPDKQPPSGGDKRGTPNRSLRQLCRGEHGRFQRLEMTLRNFLELFGGNSELADEESKLSAGLRSLLDDLEKATKKGPTRARLIRQLRNCVNEPDAVRWLDAIGTSSRQQDEAAFLFPLLAEAGSEGVNSFVGNFYGRLCDHLPVNVLPSEFWSSEQGRLSTARLKSALFGDAFAQAREKDAAGGLYFPGLVEAPNVGQKFVSTPKKRANPWEFVLAMEGMLLWSSALTRRAEVSVKERTSFPFFCESSLGGADSLGPLEVPGHGDAKTRGELWCPLWERPVSMLELGRLFVEGRITTFGKTATRATQFAAAVSSFGMERGVTSFHRVGLLERSGSGDNRTTLAIPLGEWTPRRLPDAELVHGLDQFQRAVGELIQHHDNQPRRIVLARTRMEEALFRFAGQPISNHTNERQAHLLTVLTTAATLEKELGVTAGAVKFKRGEKLQKRTVSPITPQPFSWLHRDGGRPACPIDDRTPEFRLARAMATICPWGESERDHIQGPAVESLRGNLLPLRRNFDSWTWDETTRSAVWSRGAPLLENCARVLQRRLIDSTRGRGDGLPVWSFFGANFTDLLALWNGELDEDRLSDLIHAVALVDVGRPNDKRITDDQQEFDPTPDLSPSRVYYDRDDNPRVNFDSPLWKDNPLLGQDELKSVFALPRAYALLKLCFVGGRLPARPVEASRRPVARSGNEPHPPTANDVLSLLLAGQSGRAIETAARKLRAKGYPPVVTDSAMTSGEFELSPNESRRMAGLLLMPIQHVGVLAALAIKPIAH